MRAFALMLALLAGCEREVKPPQSFKLESIEQLKTTHKMLDAFAVGDDRALIFGEGENNYLVMFYHLENGAYRPYGAQNHLAGVERPTVRAGWVEAKMRAHGAWMRVTAGGVMPSPIQEGGIRVGP